MACKTRIPKTDHRRPPIDRSSSQWTEPTWLRLHWEASGAEQVRIAINRPLAMHPKSRHLPPCACVARPKLDARKIENRPKAWADDHDHQCDLGKSAPGFPFCTAGLSRLRVLLSSSKISASHVAKPRQQIQFGSRRRRRRETRS